VRRRSVFSGSIVILLLGIAFVLGYLTDQGLTVLEKHLYPVEFSEIVNSCAEMYDLDEAVIYALIKETSSFSSNHVSEDGKIGLMQLSKETFLWLTEEKLGENLDPGLLYEPQTNVRYGSYYLLTLTSRYEDWETVFAAYLYGSEKVDAWIAEWKTGQKTETDTEFMIPDAQVRQEVQKIQRTIEKYHELYKQKGETTS